MKKAVLMDPKTIDQLEVRIQVAITEVLAKMGPKRLPLLLSQQTMHPMAKAAVAVYETAVESNAGGEE